MVLATCSPATAQKGAPPQQVMHTASYASEGKGGVADEKKPSGDVTIPIRVFPNPSTGSFRARMYGSKAEQVRIEILDQWGRVIDARQVSASADLRFGYWYLPGTYFIHIIQGEKHSKIKLVKVAE